MVICTLPWELHIPFLCIHLRVIRGYLFQRAPLHPPVRPVHAPRHCPTGPLGPTWSRGILFREREFRTTSSPPPPYPPTGSTGRERAVVRSRRPRRVAVVRRAAVRRWTAVPQRAGAKPHRGPRWMGGWVARCGGVSGIFVVSGAYPGAHRAPGSAPRVARPPPPAARPGRAVGADGTGVWSSFPTTVSGPTFLKPWRPVGGNVVQACGFKRNAFRYSVSGIRYSIFGIGTHFSQNLMSCWRDGVQA
eukprot:gene12906-biopygen11028